MKYPIDDIPAPYLMAKICGLHLDLDDPEVKQALKPISLAGTMHQMLLWKSKSKSIKGKRDSELLQREYLF